MVNPRLCDCIYCVSLILARTIVLVKNYSKEREILI